MKAFADESMQGMKRASAKENGKKIGMPNRHIVKAMLSLANTT